MRRISFIIALISLFILLILLNSPPKPLSSPEELQKFQPNQKLLLQGNVIKETYSKNYKTLFLDNEFQLQCPFPCPSFLNKNISAIALLEKYNNKNYLKILSIKSID